MANKQKEFNDIFNALYTLKNASCSEKKKFRKEYKDNGYVSLNGYYFQDDVYCYIIWKPTDIETEPEYKGEDLFKIMPKHTVDFNKCRAVKLILDSQAWCYV